MNQNNTPLNNGDDASKNLKEWSLVPAIPANEALERFKEAGISIELRRSPDRRLFLSSTDLFAQYRRYHTPASHSGYGLEEQEEDRVITDTFTNTDIYNVGLPSRKYIQNLKQNLNLLM